MASGCITMDIISIISIGCDHYYRRFGTAEYSKIKLHEERWVDEVFTMKAIKKDYYLKI
jgi:hypothetical protein